MVYKIIKYNLIGKTITTFEPLPNVIVKQDNNKNNKYYEPDNSECLKSHLWEYTEIIPENAIPHTEKLLPYFADVIEDIPSSYKNLKPKIFKNCQLLSEKHGGYLQFYHPETNQKLRIALNSNIYTPINN